MKNRKPTNSEKLISSCSCRQLAAEVETEPGTTNNEETERMLFDSENTFAVK